MLPSQHALAEDLVQRLLDEYEVMVQEVHDSGYRKDYRKKHKDVTNEWAFTIGSASVQESHNHPNSPLTHSTNKQADPVPACS